MEASLTDLGNLMVEHSWSVDWGLAEGCRCGSCHNFKFLDLDGLTVHEDDTLEGLIRTAVSASAEDTHG